MNRHVHPSVETYTGQLVDLLNPNPATIYLQDVAWALARQARFNGHTHGVWPYSVAQHSVLVAQILERQGFAAQTIVQGLLHDAHEAYVGDVVSPVAHLSRSIKKVLDQAKSVLQAAIHQSLEVPEVLPHAARQIGEADRMALAIEAHHLMASKGRAWEPLREIDRGAFEDLRHLFRKPMSPQEAYQDFWLAFHTLKGGFTLQALCA